MAVRDSTNRRGMPAALLEAIEQGELSQQQLRELIGFEAEDLCLSFDEAVRRAREGTLPKTAVGMDLELLVQALDC